MVGKICYSYQGATPAGVALDRRQYRMQFDPERVLVNVRNATTEDLLDRVTVYRAGSYVDGP
jgi:hypothetical protein